MEGMDWDDLHGSCLLPGVQSRVVDAASARELRRASVASELRRSAGAEHSSMIPQRARLPLILAPSVASRDSHA